MPPSAPPGPATDVADVRLVGFADRAPLERAQAWVDGQAVALDAEEVDVAVAAGRVPAEALTARWPFPEVDRAGEDGYAVRAADTVGASAQDPLVLTLHLGGSPLPAGHATLVSAGAALPEGADAVLPFAAAQAAGPRLEVWAAVAGGVGVERAGQQVAAGTLLAPGGRPLRPQEAALLAACGVRRVRVLARPRIRLVVAGAKAASHGGAADAHAPLLGPLVARDGGTMEHRPAGGELGEALRRAVGEPGADLVIVTGRSGTGQDDEAPSALAACGRLELHGVALRPGGSSGLGRAGGRPVLLLPGDPLACLVAYELLAGRLVRRLAGRAPGLPHPHLEVEAARKLVSTVGSVEACQVRLEGGRAVPLGVAETGGLGEAGRADGFVLIPAALEGYPAGARVIVHAY